MTRTPSRTLPTTLRLGVAALTAVLLAGCGATSTPSAETRTPGAVPSSAGAPSASADDLAATDVLTGLTTPWELIPLADGSLLTAERDTGKILRVRDGKATELRTIAESRSGNEGGLLGLAITPDAKRVLAYYSTDEDNRIVSMTWDGTTLGDPAVIFDGIRKGGRHNGGRMVVGPDGYLYVGAGDAGDTSTAQDRSSINGKILRLTLDGKPAPGNPFGDAIWSLGHRNPQGLVFDDQGRLWSSEFGESSFDELNLITKGANYGWPEVEGSGDLAGMTNPKAVWPTSQASPSGLGFWRGSLWMAALRGERLWQIPVQGTDVGEPTFHFSGEYGRLRAVAVAAGGDALLVTTSNTDGRGGPKTGDDRILRVS